MGRRVVVEDVDDKEEEETEEKEEEETEEKPDDDDVAEKGKSSTVRDKQKQKGTTPTENNELVDCPDCDVPIRAEKLGKHRYSAHGIDRREQKDRPKRETPKGPQKRKGAADDSDKETGDKSSGHNLSKSWFG